VILSKKAYGVRDEAVYACKLCYTILSGKAWKRRRLHGGSLECPKCHKKLHHQELIYIEEG